MTARLYEKVQSHYSRNNLIMGSKHFHYRTTTWLGGPRMIFTDMWKIINGFALLKYTQKLLLLSCIASDVIIFTARAYARAVLGVIIRSVCPSVTNVLCAKTKWCIISGINFHFHFVNQFHFFMLTSIHPSLLHFPHPSPLHSFTLNSKLTFLINLFRHRSLTIDISDWLPRLVGPFSVFTVFVGVISRFWCGRQNQLSSFSAHGKIGNFIIITTNILKPHESAITLLFWYLQWLVGDAPFPLKSALKVIHPLRKMPTSTDFCL